MRTLINLTLVLVLLLVTLLVCMVCNLAWAQGEKGKIRQKDHIICSADQSTEALTKIGEKSKAVGAKLAGEIENWAISRNSRYPNKMEMEEILNSSGLKNIYTDKPIKSTGMIDAKPGDVAYIRVFVGSSIKDAPKGSSREMFLIGYVLVIYGMPEDIVPMDYDLDANGLPDHVMFLYKSGCLSDSAMGGMEEGKELIFACPTTQGHSKIFHQLDFSKKLIKNGQIVGVSGIVKRSPLSP